MKNYHIISLGGLILCSSIVLSSFKTTGMHASATGGPGELGNCSNASTGCHSNASITTDKTGIVNTLTFSTPDSSYVPGQTYTVTVQAKKTGIVKFGFGIVALRNSNTSNSGKWTITDASRTHIIAGSGSLATRSYITHTSAGTTATASGLDKWSFNWTAPATNDGLISFYYCTNCTNNNGANTGDALYLSSFTIHPKSTTSIAEWMNEADLKITVDRSSHELLLNYQLIKECELSVNLLDAQGKVIQRVESANKSAGQNTDRIDLAHEISSGMYLVSLNINNQTMTKKIMVQ